MHRRIATSKHFPSTLGPIANRAIVTRIASLGTAICGLLFIGAAFGDENNNKNAETPKNATDAVAKPAPSGEQIRRASSDRGTRTHAALGVLLTQEGGAVRITETIPGSPAEKAGLMVGDEVRFVDDNRIRTTQDLADVINAYVPGKQVDLTIRRSGRRQIVPAELASWESTFSNRERTVRNDTWRSQRIRGLEQQIYRQQQEINALRNLRQPIGSRAQDLDQWWERVHHGESDNDPALFQ